MNRDQILEAIKELAKSQGFYSRFLHHLESDPQGELVLMKLESYNFKDAVDLVLFLEG